MDMAEFERQRAAGAAAEAAVHERRVAAAALRTRAAGEAAFAAAKQARVVLAMASGGEGRTNVIELSADVLALIIAKLPFSRKMIDKAPTCRAFAHAVCPCRLSRCPGALFATTVFRASSVTQR